MNLLPMLATEQDPRRLVGLVQDGAWAFQRKLDGHRVLIHVQADRVDVIGRDGQRSQHWYRLATGAYLEAYRSLGRTDVVFDGELVDGVVWVFDLVRLAPEVGPMTAYLERWKALVDLWAKWSPDEAVFRIVPTAVGPEAKAELALECLQGRAEGVVARRQDGHYLSGRRSPQLLKFKFVSEADMVVIGLRHEGKDNAVLGVHDAEGQMVEVGRASTLGKGDIQVGDVVLVRYQHFSDGDRLVQPRILRRRVDKPRSECTLDQLVRGGARA